MSPRPSTRPARLAALMACAGALQATPAAAGPGRPVEAQAAAPLHARAVQAFRQGRFPEAYGRFVALANAGHAASARQAVWMCRYGRTHFGHDWDCTPDQVRDWTAAAGRAEPAPFPALAAMPAAADEPVSTRRRLEALR